jgi:hypothetical protein
MSSDRFVTVTLLPSPPRQEIQDTKRAPVARPLVSDPRKGETSPRKAKHESCPIPADIPGNMRAASHHARRDVAAHEWKARAPGTTTLTEARYVTVTHLTDATRYPISLSPNVFRDTRWIIVIIHELPMNGVPPGQTESSRPERFVAFVADRDTPSILGISPVRDCHK